MTIHCQCVHNKFRHPALIVVIPLMFVQSVLMAFLSLALVPVFALHFLEKMKRQFLRVDEAEGELTTIVQENLTGIRVVRAFARQDFEIEKFHDKARYLAA